MATVQSADVARLTHLIEQKLFVMYLEHRMRSCFMEVTILRSGWSEMLRDLTEIRELAADMRGAQTNPK